MIFKLIKKEFSLCSHATAYLFLSFACFVFIPNYPYEVMFFFSGLSISRICMTARENGDAAFSCTLPVKKRTVAVGRILFCALFQCALLLFAGVTIALKSAFFPVTMQENLAGSCANLALIGHGGVLLGTFNLIFFPLYFKDVKRVGIPFFLASAAEFFIIAVLIVLRHAAPVYSTILTTPDFENMKIKAIFFVFGLVFYVGVTALSCHISANRFQKADL